MTGQSNDDGFTRKELYFYLTKFLLKNESPQQSELPLSLSERGSRFREALILRDKRSRMLMRQPSEGLGFGIYCSKQTSEIELKKEGKQTKSVRMSMLGRKT